MNNVRELVAWQRAMTLAVDLYSITESFPKREMYRLVSQIREAGVSVPSNIAEGKGRVTAGEFLQFLGQARGSLYEIDTHVEIARRLHYIDDQQAQRIFDEIRFAHSPLSGLITHATSKKSSRR